MSKDLQIIKELESKFGKLGFFEYKLNSDKVTELRFGRFYLKVYANKVIKLKLNSKILPNPRKHYVTNKDLKLIGELTSLQKLDLYNNKITEIKSLDGLVNLQKLSLSSNKITEIKGLDKLVNLQKLDLSDNKISKIESLNELVNLQELHLGWNYITEIKGLDRLTSLRHIGFYGNNIPKSQIDQFKINNPEITVHD